MHIGQRINERFEIIRVLGTGGFAITFEVKDHSLGGAVRAAKVLTYTGERFEEVRAYFHREASILANAGNHPMARQYHFPNIKDIIEWEGSFILIQEFIPGASMDRFVPMSSGEAEAVLVQVLQTLYFLHEELDSPVIHRDIKPSNLMRTPTGAVYLIDFGAVRELGKAEQGSDGFSTRIVTPGFGAPEQVSGGQVFAATDLYSLSMTTLSLLTGKHPDLIKSDANWCGAWSAPQRLDSRAGSVEW